MESTLEVVVYIIFSVALAFAITLFFSQEGDWEKYITDGERYSKLTMIKTIEREGEVIYQTRRKAPSFRAGI